MPGLGGFLYCRADVTALLRDHPGPRAFNGTYFVGDVDAEPGFLNPDGTCQNQRECQGKYAAWSLILVYTADRPGLFAKIAGAMALTGASIVDAKIVTLTNGMALDTFSIQDSRRRAFDNPERLKKRGKRIEDTLAGRLRPEDSDFFE